MERREITVHADGSAIPLCAGDLALGALYLASPVLLERDIEFIHVLANQAAVAIRNAQLYELATVDRLTGTCVRAFFEQWMLRELRAAFRAEQPISFLMVDVDDMKGINNDSAGHLAGDQAASRPSVRALREATRGTDFVGRYGGDEFCIILPQTTRAGAELVASRILALLDIADGGNTSLVRVSIGLSVLEPGVRRTGTIRQSAPPISFAEMAKSLIRAADEGLYRAKHDGGSCSREGSPPVLVPRVSPTRRAAGVVVVTVQEVRLLLRLGIAPVSTNP